MSKERVRVGGCSKSEIDRIKFGTLGSAFPEVFREARKRFARPVVVRREARRGESARQ